MKCQSCGKEFKKPNSKANNMIYCKECGKKEEALNRVIRKTIRQISTKLILSLIKDHLVCTKCAQKVHFASLDFHHLKDKKYSISFLQNNGMMEAMLDEIQKCIPLCANCHREVHYVNSRYRVWI